MLHPGARPHSEARQNPAPASSLLRLTRSFFLQDAPVSVTQRIPPRAARIVDRGSRIMSRMIVPFSLPK